MKFCPLYSFSPIGFTSCEGRSVCFRGCGDELVLLDVRMCVHDSGFAILMMNSVQGLVCLWKHVPVESRGGVSMGASLHSFGLKCVSTLLCEGLGDNCLYCWQVALVPRDGRILVGRGRLGIKGLTGWRMSL